MEPPDFHQADGDEILSGALWLNSIENIQIRLKSREFKRHLLHEPHNFTLSI